VEVKENNPIWLDESHPNFKRWQHARNLSIERGKFVNAVINQQIKTTKLNVLDLGSGEGGTTKVFSDDNYVVSLDLSLIRLQRQKENVIPKEYANKQSDSSICHFDQREKSESNIVKDFSVSQRDAKAEDSFEMTKPEFVNGSALQLPFTNSSFDLIIIQDVIEHLINTSEFYSEIKRVLKTNGYIYLSTPNKFSIFNIINDPHFGLPVLSFLKRKSIKKYFLKHFRKDDYSRKDIAQLLSLNELINLFNKDFHISINTKFSVQELFKGNEGIVWSDFHLKLIALCKFIKLDWVIKRIANDKIGVLNKYFTPTFYIILNKTSH
jgi:SAM-dependent methyltransferase